MKLIVLNSPYLGGAERSILHQIQLLPSLSMNEFKFLIPSLVTGDTLELSSFIDETYSGKKYCSIFKFPKSLFAVSRSSSLIKNLVGLFSLPILVVRLRNFVKESELIWCNGNKVGLPFYLSAKFFGFKGKFIWHFRDYPSNGLIFRQIWKMFGNENFQLTCIGNSKSVASQIRSLTRPSVEIQTIYNPVGKLNISKNNNHHGVKTIGCVSMLAPWKGIHDVINCALFFEKELLELGVEQISIFGEQIYQTGGEHQHYADEIKRLAKGSKLIKFRGKQNPEIIYSEIDLLIHSSIQPEPFGRILTEAFHTGVPVISTGLGGAGEIVIDGETGLRYFPHHYQQLFNVIKVLCQNERLRSDLCAGAKARLMEIENDIKSQIVGIVNGV